jgi:hypothetical protein
MIDYSLEIKNAKKRLKKNFDHKLIELNDIKIISTIYFGVFWATGTIALFFNPIAAIVGYIFMTGYLIMALDMRRDIKEFIKERK